MCYIYRLENDKSLIPKEDNVDMNYLSVKRKASYMQLRDYSNEIIDMYAAGIIKYMEGSVGRKHYQSACRYLRRMIKLGGREKVNNTISILREKYPQRRVLMEELNNV